MLTHFHPVIVAGGSGTRFWPLSRRKLPKQVLALEGKDSMVQQALARLTPLAPKPRTLVITGAEMAPSIRKQLKGLKPAQILAEPASRNTAPAMGLAAHILLRRDPDAVLGIFPADQVIADVHGFRAAIERGVRVARKPGHIVVLGVPPNRIETGYGYIETAGEVEPGIMRIRRFTEKPNAATAKKFIAAGNFLWNSGMFLWRAQTLVDALEQYLPATNTLLSRIAAAHGTAKFAAQYKKLYPKCRNISIDFAVMEPRSREPENEIFCVRAEFGWNDLGSWASLHEHRAAAGSADAAGNVIAAAGSYTLDARGNFIHSPKRFVAAVGVEDLVVVETHDALLITTRHRAQDVGKVVQHLAAKKKKALL